VKHLALLLVLLPAPALAQAVQCRLPERLEPVSPPRPDGPVRRTAVAGFTLAASWSPEYCRSRNDRSSMQCSGRNGSFGFILHGLWPEGGKGPPPQWCALAPRPSAQLLRQHLCISPSARLLEHEWAKHGSCMTRTPQAYFRTAAILWRSIRWPDANSLAHRNNLSVGDFRRAFLERNPDWRAEQIGVALTRNGWLREVQLCYGKNFMPSACSRAKLGAPDAANMRFQF